MTGRYQAVIMDMDGVVTDTATVHAAAWKQLFDGFLAGGSAPFTDEDYRRHVDGRVRIDGVTGFLASRGIELPLGTSDDPPSALTAWGLANRKNELFVTTVTQGGARPFHTTLELAQRLRTAGVRLAVVTASRNAGLVLSAAGAGQMFDVTVDGNDAEDLGLPGKPDPATFLEAACRLGVTPATSVVVEDALPGVEAGRRGRFGLVVGVDRGGHPDAFRRAGADVVVTDLGELPDELIFGSNP